MPQHYFHHLCREEAQQYFLESQLVQKGLPIFSAFSCCSVPLCQSQIKNKAISSLSSASGIKTQLDEKPLLAKGSVSSHCSGSFVLGVPLLMLAGLDAASLNAPHLGVCYSLHGDFHRCPCLLPAGEKFNLCVLAGVQTVPSLMSLPFQPTLALRLQGPVGVFSHMFPHL